MGGGQGVGRVGMRADSVNAEAMPGSRTKKHYTRNLGNAMPPEASLARKSLITSELAPSRRLRFVLGVMSDATASEPEPCLRRTACWACFASLPACFASLLDLLIFLEGGLLLALSLPLPLVAFFGVASGCAKGASSS